GDGILATLTVGHVLENERFALALRQTTKLQTNQRMQLGIFVDRRRDANELSGLVEALHIFAQRGPERRHLLLPSDAMPRRFLARGQQPAVPLDRLPVLEQM